MLKFQRISSIIDNIAHDLNSLSQEIWLNPELGFNENYAHRILTEFLSNHGFLVTPHYIVSTGFRAEYGNSDRPNIAVFCEYDALPGLGHACGHNLIAEVGIAAGVAIKLVLESLFAHDADFKGKVTIFGSPAEEGGGGKIKMMAGGALKSIDAAVMAHPSNYTVTRPKTQARRMLRAQFNGKASHAACAPWAGVNALDAAFSAYSALANLRQQMASSHSVHGIITNGGKQANIIPDHTELQYYVRAPSNTQLNTFYERVISCFEGAAIATGCTVTYSEDCPVYKEVMHNEVMADLFEKYAEHFNLPINREHSVINSYNGSTDMGNVSYEAFYSPPLLYSTCSTTHAGVCDSIGSIGCTSKHDKDG